MRRSPDSIHPLLSPQPQTWISVAMDSAPTPTSASTSPCSVSASKLPIKRKTPDSNPSPDPNVGPSSFPPFTTFKTDSDSIVTAVHGADQRSLPFKFHRIWTEHDELRFLQGLLDCGSENLFFPRDLNVFYARFSDTMSQPYTKSQLSEKLRRLRKKYRVISTRLSKGLDQSFLSPHDRALYELSRQLWHPDYAASSPFGGGGGGGGNSKPQKSDLVGVKVNFLPTLPVESDPNLTENLESHYRDGAFGEVGLGGEERLSEVNVEFEEEDTGEGKILEQIQVDNGMGEVAVKAIMDAFDGSLKEVKKAIVNEEVNMGGCVKDVGSIWSFQRRWQEQRFAEMEALSRRMRLVFEHSLLKRQ